MATTPESNSDLSDHVATYDSFISMTKWTTISIIVLLILMAFFLL